MRIALVAAGALPIPPRDWGAVEGTIWHRKLHLERLGHHVDLFNTRMIHEVIYRLNSTSYDFVHCHYEPFVGACNAHLLAPYAVTSHFGGLYRFVPGGCDYNPAFNYLYRDTLQAPANIVLCERVRDMYLASGYRGFLRVLRNAVETEQFHWAERGNGRAICVGRVCARKRQVWLAELSRGRVPMDFVGPKDRGEGGALVEHETARYLGVWSKQTLYRRLTDYSCLVLLSESEGAPKVVLEALAAGVSVVVTAACAANLSKQPFITVLPDSENDAGTICNAIAAAIEDNGRHRADIRAYARQRFDYGVVIQEYLRIIDEFREQLPLPAAGQPPPSKCGGPLRPDPGAGG